MLGLKNMATLFYLPLCLDTRLSPRVRQGYFRFHLTSVETLLQFCPTKIHLKLVHYRMVIFMLSQVERHLKKGSKLKLKCLLFRLQMNIHSPNHFSIIALKNSLTWRCSGRQLLISLMCSTTSKTLMVYIFRGGGGGDVNQIILHF